MTSHHLTSLQPPHWISSPQSVMSLNAVYQVVIVSTSYQVLGYQWWSSPIKNLDSNAMYLWITGKSTIVLTIWGRFQKFVFFCFSLTYCSATVTVFIIEGVCVCSCTCICFNQFYRYGMVRFGYFLVQMAHRWPLYFELLRQLFFHIGLGKLLHCFERHLWSGWRSGIFPRLPPLGPGFKPHSGHCVDWVFSSYLTWWVSLDLILWGFPL